MIPPTSATGEGKNDKEMVVPGCASALQHRALPECIAVIAGQQGIEASISERTNSGVRAVVDAKSECGCRVAAPEQYLPGNGNQRSILAMRTKRLKDTCQWRDVHGVHCSWSMPSRTVLAMVFAPPSRLVPWQITGMIAPRRRGIARPAWPVERRQTPDDEPEGTLLGQRLPATPNSSNQAQQDG